MITGSLVAMVTPMTATGDLDWQALERLVGFHLDKGTDAIVAVGTTGESATLNPEEHCKVIKRVIDIVAGKIPVIAGTGANSTQEAIDLTQSAADAGADACLLVTPYYNKPNQEGLFQHYKKIAELVEIPQILYNVPGRTACDMLNETVERLATVKNIVGIKDATGDLARGKDLIERVGDKLAIYSGDDATAAEYILLGAQGDISVTANVAPQQMHDMCQAALDGNAELAREINQQLMPLHEKLFVEPSPMPVKWALNKMGLISEGIRLPLVALSDAAQPIVHAALKDARVL